MSNQHLPLPYQCGISEITYEHPLYSPSIRIYIPSIDTGEYEWREHEFLGLADGTRICVQEIVKDDYVFRYTTTKTPYGWKRQTYVCRKGEEHLFRCNFEPNDNNK